VRAFFGMALAVSLVLAGCGGSSTEGMLTGHLYASGGPSSGVRPLPGFVIAVGPSGRHVIAVGPDGTYLIKLSPGVYSVTGRSPLYFGGNGRCTTSGTVTLAQRRTSTANVICQEK
jgi:hypothetical protein